MRNWRNSLSWSIPFRVLIEGKKDISYRSEPNVDPESTTETYASGAFFVDSDRFRGVPFFFRTGKRLTQKGPWSMWSSSKPTPSLDIVCNQMSWPFISNQMKASHWASTEKRSEKKFSIAPISFDYETDATATGASPEPYEKLIFDVLNNDSTNYSHWHEVRASWQLIDRIEKLWAEMELLSMEYKSGSMGPTASDDLLAEYGAEWVWNLNLRIKESHLRVVFLIARKQKRQIVLPWFVFLIDFLKSSLQEASHEVFWWNGPMSSIFSETNQLHWNVQLFADRKDTPPRAVPSILVNTIPVTGVIFWKFFGLHQGIFDQLMHRGPARFHAVHQVPHAW